MLAGCGTGDYIKGLLRIREKEGILFSLLVMSRAHSGEQDNVLLLRNSFFLPRKQTKSRLILDKSNTA